MGNLDFESTVQSMNFLDFIQLFKRLKSEAFLNIRKFFSARLAHLFYIKNRLYSLYNDIFSRLSRSYEISRFSRSYDISRFSRSYEISRLSRYPDIYDS